MLRAKALKARIAILSLMAPTIAIGAEGETSIAPMRPAGAAVGASSSADVRSVQVVASGETAEQARQEAVRLAIQQVAGVFVDHRRQVELKVAQSSIDDVVKEKVLSYTNAHVESVTIISTEQIGNNIVVTAKVDVKVKPLLKVLSDSVVPVIGFDSISAASKAESLSQKKADAVTLYADMLARLDKLVSVKIGKPAVDESKESAVGTSWIKVPVQLEANAAAIDEWREKFDIIAAKKFEVLVTSKRESFNRNKCNVPEINMYDLADSVDRATEKGGQSNSRSSAAATVCFAQSGKSAQIPADCFHANFPENKKNPYEGRCEDEGSCTQVSHFNKKVLSIELLDQDNDRIDGQFINFSDRYAPSGFPKIERADQNIYTPYSDTFKIDFCSGKSDVFYDFHRGSSARSQHSIFFIPKRGTKIDFEVALPVSNEDIPKIAKVRAAFKTQLKQ
ncbi:hypothetical protein [Methylobacterium sp. WCS2018Hpa-22]|uniref:hypothetical protein n=1 Tax=Methylobacterium sp. WCS2018Hpa-22 TaxID=3073633 RepID=UPI0028897976|nr:hypothetical protein [Methylobacterium sp. WCS2018Hpa-22]